MVRRSAKVRYKREVERHRTRRTCYSNCRWNQVALQLNVPVFLLEADGGKPRANGLKSHTHIPGGGQPSGEHDEWEEMVSDMGFSPPLLAQLTRLSSQHHRDLLGEIVLRLVARQRGRSRRGVDCAQHLISM
jgi:hypothetical protein